MIDTTRNHRFWGATLSKWTKAGALKHGDHLRTSNGVTATVVGGHTPADTTGWMWDLTIPGGNDHDFYIDTIVGTVLVHNCDDPSLDEQGEAHIMCGPITSQAAAGLIAARASSMLTRTRTR